MTMPETESLTKFDLPLQLIWKSIYCDLPLTLVSESLRFAGSRLQAQGDYLSTLLSCRSFPEVIETQSGFVRKAIGEFGAETGRIMKDLRNNISKAA